MSEDEIRILAEINFLSNQLVLMPASAEVTRMSIQSKIRALQNEYYELKKEK